ncbi:hypothetical protein AAFN46_20505 [Pseudomonas sp. CAU 1711]|uniref:hypothetical protein n=1 Tax=Pseudomonas sp. CAU 1711 TaxID=3140356 RepID=UPI0032613150
MVMHIKRIADGGLISLVALWVLLFSSIADAYQINPLENKYWVSRSPSVSVMVSESVHEEITNRARVCAAVSVGVDGSPLTCTTMGPIPTGSKKGNKYDSLIRGVWWNDDPNQLLFAHVGKWGVWMKDANRIAKYGLNLRGERKTLNKTYYMQYRSHYGDLQFLHAMATSNQEAAQVTRQHILDWAEFSYAVAIRRINTQTLLSDVKTSHFQEHFKNQPGWTVSYLFGPKYRLERKDHFQEMAIGSLLHLIQDSYSDAHALRNFEPSEKCPLGRVIEFHSYGKQNPDLHGVADTRAAMKSQKFTKEQHPVNASATILRFMDDQEDWPVVKAYLRDTVFCLDADAQGAGPGRYAQK